MNIHRSMLDKSNIIGENSSHIVYVQNGDLQLYQKRWNGEVLFVRTLDKYECSLISMCLSPETFDQDECMEQFWKGV